MNASRRPGLGFSRARRLLKGADFERVFQSAQRSSDRFFTVLARRSGEAGARLGMAVGKKRIRRAVGRNRIKRLVRESFRQHADGLDGFDIVVLCRSSGEESNQELLRSLAGHWQRLATDSNRHGPARAPHLPE